MFFKSLYETDLRRYPGCTKGAKWEDPEFFKKDNR
jgi:hypothetical protein